MRAAGLPSQAQHPCTKLRTKASPNGANISQPTRRAKPTSSSRIRSSLSVEICPNETPREVYLLPPPSRNEESSLGAHERSVVTRYLEFTDKLAAAGHEFTQLEHEDLVVWSVDPMTASAKFLADSLTDPSFKVSCRERDSRYVQALRSEFAYTPFSPSRYYMVNACHKRQDPESFLLFQQEVAERRMLQAEDFKYFKAEHTRLTAKGRLVKRRGTSGFLQFDVAGEVAGEVEEEEESEADARGPVVVVRLPEASRESKREEETGASATVGESNASVTEDPAVVKPPTATRSWTVYDDRNDEMAESSTGDLDISSVSEAVPSPLLTSSLPPSADVSDEELSSSTSSLSSDIVDTEESTSDSDSDNSSPPSSNVTLGNSVSLKIPAKSEPVVKPAAPAAHGIDWWNDVGDMSGFSLNDWL